MAERAPAGVAGSSAASGLRTIRRVAPYLWPPGDRAVRARVVAAMAALVVSKLATVVTPFFFKEAVDGLAPSEPSAQAGFLLVAGPVALTVFYGLMRLAGVGFAQARDAIFARVGQGALRHLALETFRHIHALSLRYHVTRKTGGLSRVIERGVKGVDFLLRFLLFSIVPLILELALVGAILFFVFDVWYLVVVAVTICALRLVHLQGHRVAGEDPRGDERARHRRQPEGDRQPAELRDRQVLRRRGARGRALRRLDAGLRGGGDQDAGQPRLAEPRAEPDHHRRARRGDGDGGARRAGRGADGRRLRDGQRLHDPDHHAARASSAPSTARSARRWSTWRRCSTCSGSRRRSSTGPARGRSGSTAGRIEFRDVAFHYETRALDPARARPRGRAGADRGGGRAVRVGQVDHRRGCSSGSTT